MMQEKYLLMENVDVRLGSRKILENINFSVQKGEFWSILGPNGSGKTTFLRALGGWLPYEKGQVLLQGQELKNMARKTVARKIAMVAVQESNNSFTVKETVFMGRFSHLGRFGSRQQEDEEAVALAMNEVGVYDKKDRLMNKLSQGERQKVWVARALAQDADILLMDEPTAHLDVKNQSEVFSLLEKLCSSQKLAVIAILHDINLALSFSSNLLFLQSGRIRTMGPKADVIDIDELEQLYQIPFELERDNNGACWVKILYKK